MSSRSTRTSAAANMFVRAVGLDHSLEIADVAEWFEVTYELGRARPA